ncbi:MAG: hypothetical protein RMM28_10870, partial [Thermoleophilia bacterium]|nr:hypothetical protein [Thermoleophilia bacterium]
MGELLRDWQRPCAEGGAAEGVGIGERARRETKTLERGLAALAPVGSERQTMPRPLAERASHATRDGSTCGYQHAELF